MSRLNTFDSVERCKKVGVTDSVTSNRMGYGNRGKFASGGNAMFPSHNKIEVEERIPTPPVWLNHKSVCAMVVEAQQLLLPADERWLGSGAA